MRYYTIQDEQLITADKEEALTRYYNNVLPLPEDYEYRKYIVVDGVLVLNPNYEQEKAAKEAERIGNLQCTKRVFVLMLERLGLDYFEQIEPAINANRQAKLEWELCVELQRKNPLIDELAGGFGITSKQLDDLFKFANGEITQEEFIGE